MSQVEITMGFVWQIYKPALNFLPLAGVQACMRKCCRLPVLLARIC